MEAVEQRWNLLDNKLKNYKLEKLKRKLPVDNQLLQYVKRMILDEEVTEGLYGGAEGMLLQFFEGGMKSTKREMADKICECSAKVGISEQQVKVK